MNLFAVFLLAVLVASFWRAPEKAPELFAVLPARDGHVGAIVVRGPGSEKVINEAYASVSINGSTQTNGSLSQAQVREMFGSTIEALPGSPASFTLYFLEGKDELTPESLPVVGQILAELARRPAPEIFVIGHTDARGSHAANDALSLQRAGRMRDELVKRGVPAERIHVEGRGKRELLISTPDGVAEPRNRRVEISVR